MNTTVLTIVTIQSKNLKNTLSSQKKNECQKWVRNIGMLQKLAECWAKENKTEYGINPVNDPIVYIPFNRVQDLLSTLDSEIKSDKK